MNSSQLIALGSYRFDPGKGQLVDGAGQPVRLRNKSLRVLEVLVGAAGRIVGKEEIIAAAWEQTFVSDESLSQCISDIRRGLRDTKREILRTIPGRGFVLTASPVEPPSPGRLPIVAVEPIRTDEADPEAFRVAERIREEILRAITRRRGIRVTSGAPNGAETDYRISGAVRNTGNTVSAFMEIEEIDGRGIFHAEAFELSDESRDDFAERVARKITNVQRVSAIAHFGERLRDHPDDDLDLQQLLQKAAFHYSRITEEDTDAARSVLSSAVERFPSSPMALAMLAATEVHMYPLIALDRSEDRVSAALDLAERAVRAGPEIDFCLRTRGNLKLWLQRDHEGAIEDCRRALAVTPNFQLAHLTLLQCDLFDGRIAMARERLERHIEIDIALPQYHYFQTLLSLCALLENDTVTAQRHAREAYEYAPWSDWGVLVLGATFANDMPRLIPAAAERTAKCRLSVNHFREIPIRDESVLKTLSDRAMLAGL